MDCSSIYRSFEVAKNGKEQEMENSPVSITGIHVVLECFICGQKVMIQGIPRACGAESRMLAVCKDCDDRYLRVGVALVNPETKSVIVLMDEAFKIIFNEPVPEHRILYTDTKLLKRICAFYKATRQERAKSVKGPWILPN